MSKIIAAYGGGFKPPQKGHFEVVQKALNDSPEIEEFIIYVGGVERGGINQAQSILIWEIYQTYLPMKVKIEPSKSPIGDVIRLGKKNPQDEVYFVIGARDGFEDDIKDIESRTKNIEEKYPNMKIKVITTSDSDISGTNARQASKVSYDDFIKFIPSELSDSEKEEVYNIVKPALNENASYSKDIDVKGKIMQLTQHMLDKGMNIEPLPKVEFVDGDSDNARYFLGKTAYYNPENQTIVLYTEGRHPKDIVRSFSHEMIHHIQNLEGRLGNITTTNTQEDDHLNNIEAEANLTGTMTFRNWTDSLNENIAPLKSHKVYHSTDSKFEDFSLDYAWDGFWFTDDLDSLKNRTAGASGGKYILTRYITLKNPAGWDEYDKYSIGELIDMGYDGVILPDPGRTDYIVFNPKSISKNIDSLNEGINEYDNSGPTTPKVYIVKDDGTYKEAPIELLSKISNLTYDMGGGETNYYPEKNIVIVDNIPVEEFAKEPGDIKGEKVYVEYNLNNSTSLPKASKIIASQLVYHLDNHEAFAQTVANSLKDGGTFEFQSDLMNKKDKMFLQHLSDEYGFGLPTKLNQYKQESLPLKKGEFVEPIISYIYKITDKDDKTSTLSVTKKGKWWEYEKIDGDLDFKTGKFSTPPEDTDPDFKSKERTLRSFDKYLSYFGDSNTIVDFEKLNEANKPYKHKHGFDDKLGKDPFGLNENKQINYTNPNFNTEWEEAIRYPEFKEMGKDGWLKIANQGKPVSYSSIKDKLGNVDLDFEGLEEPKKQRFLDAFKKGTIEMPIAVKFSDSDYDLIAGNTRLSGLVKNGIDSKIWIVDISNIQEKKNKDPFGLNQYARELAQGLEEAIVGKKVECDNCDWSWNIKDGGDDLYTCHKCGHDNTPKQLTEGRYDTLTNKLSSIAFEAFKDIHDRGDKEGSFKFRVDHPDDEHDIPSKDFYFDFEGVVEITDDEYGVDGGANAGFDNEGDEITPLLSVQFKIPKYPDWQKVSFDIKDVVRHELEHLTQDGYNEKTGKYMEDDQLLRDLIDADMLSKSAYFRLEKEVDAMLQGLYFKAKKAKRPFKDVINDYLNIFIDQETITQEEKENILDIWRSRGKSLSLPLFEQMGDMNYEIYSDMDGVLTDFDASFMKASDGILPSEYEKTFGKDGFWELIDGKGVGFWVGMPWMSDGKTYWDYIKKYTPILLSSPSMSQSSRLGKRLWVKNNLPGTKLILAQAKDKQNYAQKNRILIDDRPSNIDQWRASGGIGILHTSASDTIRQLKELGL